jgi:hypothetical protein
MRAFKPKYQDENGVHRPAPDLSNRRCEAIIRAIGTTGGTPVERSGLWQGSYSLAYLPQARPAR